MIHTPQTGDQLSDALVDALSGDEIHLTPGVRYVGPFDLPPGDGVLVKSAGLLPMGRVQEADTSLLATLASDIGAPVLTADHLAGGWHFYGINFEPFTGIQNGEAIVLQGADDITFDRCRIQGPPTGLKRGIRANGTRITITRCRIAGVWAPGQDAQAICAWDGAGPYTITDNYLEATSENILFGGADSSSEANMPSDILIEGNTITKDLAWKGQARQVKNLLELKAARRVVIRGNQISRNWSDAQQGRSILLTVRNQDGAAPWSRIEDVLIEGNTITEVERGFQITGYDDAHPSGQTSGIVIRDNTIQAEETAFLLGNQIKDAAIYRNKLVMAPDNVSLSLDRGIRWVNGMLQDAAVAVESLTWAGNDAPGTYIHSSTATGEAALKAHTGAYSLTVPTDSPVPVPEPPVDPTPVPDPPMPVPVPDTTPPVATMTVRPVGPRFEVTVSGADIAYVGFYVDGKIQNALTEPSVGETTWRTRVGMGKGSHVLKVVVEDAARNATTLSQPVTR